MLCDVFEALESLEKVADSAGSLPPLLVHGDEPFVVSQL
jgi:hypothetical protein